MRAGKEAFPQRGGIWLVIHRVFCLTENLFGEEVFRKAGKLSYEQAFKRIEKQIYLQNPQAWSAKVNKFITG